MAGRTISISHKGMTALIKEGHDNRCVIVFGDHTEETDKKFGPAARYALTWLLKNAGDMRGNYER